MQEAKILAWRHRPEAGLIDQVGSGRSEPKAAEPSSDEIRAGRWLKHGSHGGSPAYSRSNKLKNQPLSFVRDSFKVNETRMVSLLASG